MDDVTRHPTFLALAMKAQNNLSRCRSRHDSEFTTAQFCIHDMLDMLGAEIDRQKDQADETA